ncbi:hypothetical protein D3C78_1135500 [compost metagenome]
MGYMSKKRFVMWLVLIWLVGVLCAVPWKPRVVAPPLSQDDARAKFVRECQSDIYNRASPADKKLIPALSACTTSALAIYPTGEPSEPISQKP